MFAKLTPYMFNRAAKQPKYARSYKTLEVLRFTKLKVKKHTVVRQNNYSH